MGLETKYSLLKSWVFDGASGERASTDSGFFYFLVNLWFPIRVILTKMIKFKKHPLNELQCLWQSEYLNILLLVYHENIIYLSFSKWL